MIHYWVIFPIVYLPSQCCVTQELIERELTALRLMRQEQGLRTTVEQ